MADVVQYRLERMSDELDDLEKRGLFTRAEIAQIVKRRRDFEYRLKRPSPLKQDYLLYIDYEKQIDALRNLRKKKIIGQMNELEERVADETEKKRKKNKKWKKSISDFAGVMRILDIFHMAVNRFKGDLGLWFQYLEFCREKKHGRMKQVLAKAVKFHPKVPGLWIYAAAWEFDQNLNVTAARNLMMSGLRTCPDSEDLWIEYLRMELTYVNKLKARKVALGEEVGTVGEAEEWKKENEDLFMSLSGKSEEAEESSLTEGLLEKKDNKFGQQGSEIFQTIYRGAVEAFPSSMSLKKRFLEVLDTADLARSDDLRKELMEDIKKDFSHDELYWDWTARLQMKDKKETNDKFLLNLNKAVKVFEEAIQILPTNKMFSLYVKFWLDIFALDTEGFSTNNTEFDATKFTSSILKVFEKADACGCLTENLACQYVSFYMQIGEAEEARILAEKLCDGKFSEGANLWLLRVSIELKSYANRTITMSKTELNSVFELLIDVLTRLSVSVAESLWIMAIKTFSNEKDHFNKLVKNLTVALARGDGGESGCSISSAVVNLVLQRDGIKHAREMYKRFLALPHPSLALFRNCIQLESNLAAIGERDAIVKARQLYESALHIYGQNRELWKDYYMLELKVGTAETTNAVCWRARKILKDPFGISITNGA